MRRSSTSSTASRSPTRTAGWRTVTPPRCGSGSPPRTSTPVRRSMPVPDRDWWHERLVALMHRPVVMAVQVRRGRLFCLERPAGAEQVLLPALPADRPTSHRRAARSAPSAPPTRRTPSTGSRPRPTVSSSPSARARAAARTPCCGCSTPPTGSGRGEAIPDTRAAAWRGSPTAPASPTPATRRAISTTARCTTTSLGRQGRRPGLG